MRRGRPGRGTGAAAAARNVRAVRPGGGQPAAHPRIRPAARARERTGRTVAVVRPVRYNNGVEITLSPDLADSLLAAAQDRGNIHNNLCGLFDRNDPDHPDEELDWDGERVCTCGVPGLFVDLAMMLLPAALDAACARRPVR